MRALILFFLLCASAHAVDLDLGIGQAQYQKPGNGIWYQEPFPNQFNLTPTTYSIGLTGYMTDSLRWRAGYLNMGSVTSSALAVADDANYNGHGCNKPCLPLSHWYGTSHLDGIYFTALPEYKTGDWSFFAEGGFWIYRAKFDMDIPDWTPTFTHTEHLYVSSDVHKIGSVLGLGIKYGHTSFMVEQLDAHAGGTYPPNFNRYALNYSLHHVWELK